jgi:PPOX class probable F420-dependent enzyme
MSNDAYVGSLEDRARVARLATVDPENKPHVVPVVFVFDGIYYYVPLDEKTKRYKVEDLKRVKNIKRNPNVTLLIDEYQEDWTKLNFVIIHGKASLVCKGGQDNGLLEKAHNLLYKKYHQYQTLGMGESCIKIRPERTFRWRNK